eukprot:COSAG05_NODE_24_length_31553_cov_12.138647_19_plen_88_part_00
MTRRQQGAVDNGSATGGSACGGGEGVAGGANVTYNPSRGPARERKCEAEWGSEACLVRERLTDMQTLGGLGLGGGDIVWLTRACANI